MPSFSRVCVRPRPATLVAALAVVLATSPGSCDVRCIQFGDSAVRPAAPGRLRHDASIAALGSAAGTDAILFASAPAYRLEERGPRGPGAKGDGAWVRTVDPASLAQAAIAGVPGPVLGITRGATSTWLSTRSGLNYLAADGQFAAAEFGFAPGAWLVEAGITVSIGVPPPPFRFTTADMRPTMLAVDTVGRVWILENHLALALLPQAAAPGAQAGEYLAAGRTVVGPAALAADAHEGVWLYDCRPEERLCRLTVRDGADGPEVAVVETVARPIPALVAPLMVTGDAVGVAVVGQAADGDYLVQYQRGKASSSPLPAELFHARHVTALAADQQGRIYAATDGVGVLVREAGQWRVHPITESLPVLGRTDLKPVDDILLSEDGTLYAACQDTLAVWTP